MIIDVIVVVAVIAYAVAGYRQGVVVGTLSLAGFVIGAVLAMRLVPEFAQQVTTGPRRVLLVVLGVLVCAWLGQLLGGLLGSALRNRVTLRPARVIDQVLGAVAGGLAVLLVLWLVADALRGSTTAALSRAVSNSRVLAGVDAVMPSRVAALGQDLRRSLASGDFPRVFSGFGPEQIVPVETPDADVLDEVMLARAGRSIVKITGEAPECRRGQEGSGAVFADERVVTNAHVVAGVRAPVVQVGGRGRSYPARVVLFDSRRDVAVLAVPGLGAPVLPRGGPLDRGDDAVVAGFPRNGPYQAVPARVRAVIDAEGDDIYGRSGAVREVYSLFTRVEPGNSGGPLLDPDGEMVGLVFARSQNDASTGYALTLDEIRPTLERGATAGERVSSGECLAG